MGLLLNGENYRFVDVVGGYAKLSPAEYSRWVGCIDAESGWIDAIDGIGGWIDAIDEYRWMD